MSILWLTLRQHTYTQEHRAALGLRSTLKPRESWGARKSSFYPQEEPVLGGPRLGWTGENTQLATYLGSAWSHGILQKGILAAKKEENRVTIQSLAAQGMQE